MEPEQCEFLAENEWIMIKPNFNEDQLHLICGDVGPFEAGMPVCVPLWMAVNLKKRHRCEIIPPEWLTVDELKKMIAVETESIGFAPIPRFFLEIAHILIRNAKEDLVDVDQLKTYVQDVWDKRVAKMHTSTLKFLSQYESCHARMDNITQMEVSYAKAPIIAATRKIEELHATLRKLTPS